MFLVIFKSRIICAFFGGIRGCHRGKKNADEKKDEEKTKGRVGRREVVFINTEK
jgi:hypothetical protein